MHIKKNSTCIKLLEHEANLRTVLMQSPINVIDNNENFSK